LFFWGNNGLINMDDKRLDSVVGFSVINVSIFV